MLHINSRTLELLFLQKAKALSGIQLYVLKHDVSRMKLETKVLRLHEIRV